MSKMSLFRPFLPLKRLNSLNLPHKIDRLFFSNYKNYATISATKKESSRQKLPGGDDDINQDEPVKFTTSPASKWHAKTSRVGRVEDRPWYEPYVILVSLTVFMLYFTVFREENDIDKELGRTLYSRIDGLEEHQLRQALEYNLKNNLETRDIKKRLREIEAEKSRN